MTLPICMMVIYGFISLLQEKVVINFKWVLQLLLFFNILLVTVLLILFYMHISIRCDYKRVFHYRKADFMVFLAKLIYYKNYFVNSTEITSRANGGGGGRW